MTQQTAAQNDLLTQFLVTADRLVTAVTDLSEAELDLTAESDGWSIRQMVHHVADDGDAWCLPLKKAIATPGAPLRFEGFPGNDAWAAALAFDKRGIGPALQLIQAHRQVMAELARHFAEKWDACYVTVVDADGQAVQKLTLAQIIRMVTEHLQEHVELIEGVLEANQEAAFPLTGGNP